VTALDEHEDARASHDARLASFRARRLTQRRRRARANLSAALVVADVVMALLVVADVHGSVRAVYGLAFCVVVPGWAIVGLLRLNDTALEAGLTMATGACALIVIAQLAATLGAWHLTALQLAICLACLPSLLWQSLERRRPPAALR
jgi:uncharacterized membrane protein